MRKFEYKKIYKGRFAKLSEQELNILGNDGWELCGIYGDEYSYYYFKRELEDEQNRDIHTSGEMG